MALVQLVAVSLSPPLPLPCVVLYHVFQYDSVLSKIDEIQLLDLMALWCLALARLGLIRQLRIQRSECLASMDNWPLMMKKADMERLDRFVFGDLNSDILKQYSSISTLKLVSAAMDFDLTQMTDCPVP